MTPRALPLLRTELRYEHDVVLARTRGRQVAAELGFPPPEQTRIATAVSEIARNAFRYAGGGSVAFAVEEIAEDVNELVIRITDRGAGIGNLESILSGRYRSKTGMGIGIAGSKRLMDRFEVETRPGEGTRILMGKRIPGKKPLSTAEIQRISAALAQGEPGNPFEEIQQQNGELLRAMEEVEARQADLSRLNVELAETNRGVIALNSELDDRAASLRKALEQRTRILSYMSHEVRTPINAVLQISELLLNGTIAEPLPEQQRPLSLIRKSAEELSQIVDDLLDLGRAEAGKLVVRREQVDLQELFATLRAMFRPLAVRPGVALWIEDPAGVPVLQTDPGKISQILRNLVSNALKFTESGEVRVTAAQTGPETFELQVRDTGIGIAPEDQEKIFEEYGQVESRLQRSVKGTGLGLALTRRIATLLGGRISVESAPGAGTTFRVSLPLSLPAEAAAKTEASSV